MDFSYRSRPARSDVTESSLRRHARAETPRRVTRRGPRLRGHPRLSCRASARKAWMAGTSPAMTPELSLRARIGLAGFVQITHAFFVALRAQVDIRILGA